MIVVIETETPALEIQRISQELQRLNITPEQIVDSQKVVIGQAVGRWSQNFLNNRIMLDETHTPTFKNFLEERGFSHANRAT